MLTPLNILTLFTNHGLPNYGVYLDFLPSDSLMEDLTRRFNVEFALMFKIDHSGYNLFAGTHNSATIPIDSDEILIKHTHPRGTPHPSYDDIQWLTLCQDFGSPQKQSVILPIGNRRITFNIHTPYLNQLKMEIHNDILNNINNRYVLLKKDKDFVIIDKSKKSMVIINDPIIDKEKLIKTMIEKGVEVYDSPEKLPQPSEIPFSGKDIPTSFKLFIKKIHDKDGKETGAIISALTNKMLDINEKRRIERIMEDYAFTVLYPNEGLNIYSDVNFDTASLTIIKGINNLPDQDINWTETQLYKW